MFSVQDWRTEDNKHLRDVMYNRFKNQVSLLLESKKPKAFHSTKGRLDPRRAYRSPFSDNIFLQTTKVPNGDTTIVMLIDGSGSMDCGVEVFGKGYTRIGVCNAIVSAFSKAVNDVLGNEIKIEVFLKSAPSYHGKAITGTDNGSFVTLTRVFSNSNKNLDFDKILKLDCVSPIKRGGSNDGSYTAEYAVLPALLKWMNKNIVTKNVVLFNLTDGDAYCSLGSNNMSFNDEENKQMRIKYLRNVPNATMSIGGRSNHNHMTNVYGQNVIECDDDGFHVKMFNTFMTFIGEAL